jgi:hypothetical protein
MLRQQTTGPVNVLIATTLKIGPIMSSTMRRPGAVNHAMMPLMDTGLGNARIVTIPWPGVSTSSTMSAIEIVRRVIHAPEAIHGDSALAATPPIPGKCRRRPRQR